MATTNPLELAAKDSNQEAFYEEVLNRNTVSIHRGFEPASASRSENREESL